jgi:nicotinamidase-related amidase
MPASFTIDPARSAVLSMDYHTSIVSIYARDDQAALLARAASILKTAREAGMTVIHVRVGFHPNLPEISPRNALFSSIKSSVQHQKLFEGEAGAFHPAVAPEGNDIVVTKHRVDAFIGTDLEMILRAKDIEMLFLFGIATSGVVLSTLLHASDIDYRLAVIKDCCADRDPQVHACLIEKLFPARALVIPASDFPDVFRKPAAEPAV